MSDLFVGLLASLLLDHAFTTDISEIRIEAVKAGHYCKLRYQNIAYNKPEQHKQLLAFNVYNTLQMSGSWWMEFLYLSKQFKTLYD